MVGCGVAGRSSWFAIGARLPELQPANRRVQMQTLPNNFCLILDIAAEIKADIRPPRYGGVDTTDSSSMVSLEGSSRGILTLTLRRRSFSHSPNNNDLIVSLIESSSTAGCSASTLISSHPAS